MYAITAEFRAHRGHEDDFLGRVQQQAQDSLAREPDCLQFDVCVDPENPARVLLYEIYRDEAAFQDHLKTAHFEDFSATTADWIESKTVQAWRRTG